MTILLMGSICLAVSLFCTLVLYCTCVVAGRSRRSPCDPQAGYRQANPRNANPFLGRLNVRSDLAFRP
jgi:hypothetical protein